MKTWLISDTHMQHDTLNLPNNVDCVVHAGDSTNYKDLLRNQQEFELFLIWYANLPIKHKILIAGNHDCWAIKKYNIDKVKDHGIIYLEHEYFELEGRLIFGSPYTPTFHDWHFMKDRNKLSKYWEALIEGIDLLITHGPPKGILDLSHDKKHKLEFCGDSALRKAVFKNQPKVHQFGHIHNSKDCYNSGQLKLSILPTLFVNASCVSDGEFDKGCSSHGQIIEI
jgi:hypothetical protein